MLSKETISKLKAYGIDADKLAAAIKDEAEVSLELPEVTVFSADELKERDTIKTQLGRDLQMKDLKKEAGFDYQGEGSLDIKRFITEHQKKVEGEAIKEPGAQVKSLNEQIALLQKKNEEAEAKVIATEKAAKDAEFNSGLLSELPANRSKIIADSEYLTLIKANLEFAEEGVKRGGELLRNDKTAAPIARKEAIEQFFSERKWIEEQQQQVAGRGGGNSTVVTSGKPTTIKEAQEQFQKDNPGKSVGTAEFGAYVIGLRKENPNFNSGITA